MCVFRGLLLPTRILQLSACALPLSARFLLLSVCTAIPHSRVLLLPVCMLRLPVRTFKLLLPVWMQLLQGQCRLTPAAATAVAPAAAAKLT